jgi:carboxyl-terminal processing protease
MGYEVRTDGYYDIETKEAIEDIQTINDLELTGNVNQETALVINAFLRTYQNDQANDSQLHSALEYLHQN